MCRTPISLAVNGFLVEGLMLVAGVDEAGRGSVIGPLVVAGMLFEETQVPLLGELGVKDSKRLAPKERERILKQLEKVAIRQVVFKIPPAAIDKVVFGRVEGKSLNYLETMVMARVIRELRPDLVYLDPPGAGDQRYVSQIQMVLGFHPKIICEAKADTKFPPTSAASILAKVTRDQCVAELRERFGDFNSGYPSDWKTRRFLEEYLRNGGEEGFIRYSWKTVRSLGAGVGGHD